MWRPKRIEPAAGQESVWDYPRPPRLEKIGARLRVIFNARTVADTTAGYRVLETTWSYPSPSLAFSDIADHIAFYASRVDECWVDDERVQPQEGDFYGGWITSRIVGPFKGGAGTRGW
ncbi:DUF427 domain-containing protein [Aduncisulcus paluster]|uniref:DUF427 domain-containing protein n=1 Tax=Aduncisulcus paluster TaxID=2918883 RepID=A0ABQ5KNM4_9EUKA|nr:DUF427 domain-containing protein [Aduncisulcus paluster]